MNGKASRSCRVPSAVKSHTDGYLFTTQADLDEVTSFYETELSNLGFELELTVDENAGYSKLAFRKGDTSGMIVITPVSGLTAVLIIIIT